MVSHAQAELPNECVGLLAGLPDGRVRDRYPLVNALADPRRFESEPQSMFAAVKRCREQDFEFLAVYHSHPTSPPVPSGTDLEQNYWPGVVSIIISLLPTQPEVRAYWLEPASYREAEWVVVADSR